MSAENDTNDVDRQLTVHSPDGRRYLSWETVHRRTEQPPWWLVAAVAAGRCLVHSAVWLGLLLSWAATSISFGQPGLATGFGVAVIAVSLFLQGEKGTCWLIENGWWPVKTTAFYFLAALGCYYGLGLDGVYAISLLTGVYSAQA